MLLKHSLFYLLARGLPGIVNLLAMAIYTRLLSPDDYGRYALVIAGVGLANGILFQWLRFGVLRFFPVYEDRRQVFLSTILTGYIALVVLTGLGGAAALVFITDPVMRGLVVLGTLLLWAQALYEMNLELLRIHLAPGRYGIISVAKTTVALCIGGLLAYQGFGASGLILGLMAGMLLASFIQMKSWSRLGFRLADAAICREILTYGLPLSATFALGFVVSSSDRFLLGWFLGAGATGVYAAGYDIANQALVVLMMIVNLAAYPLAVRALEQEGEGAARQQISQNVTLLLMVALPCTVGFALLAPNIASVFLGKAFRASAVMLIPWIAFGSLLAGIKSFYFDLSFQMGRSTIGQVWVTLAAAIVNIALNFWWIPHVGIMGAAYATVVAYAAAMGLSWLLGRRLFRLPFPARGTSRIVLAVAGMGGVLWSLRSLHGAAALGMQITAGIVVYGALVLAFNVAGMRSEVLRMLSRGSDA